MPSSRSSSIPVPLRLVETPESEGPRVTTPTAVFAIGDRADAIRLGPVFGATQRLGAFIPVVVLTGRSQDQRVVCDLGEELGLGTAAHALTIDGLSDAEVTAQTLTSFDRLLGQITPEVIVLTGDSDTTLACALAAAKQKVAVAHVDSGLRSWDWSTPAEINRVVIDRLSDTLFTHSHNAAENLTAEGVPPGRIEAVGSTVLDALSRIEPRARKRNVWEHHHLGRHEYVLVVITGGGERLQDPAQCDVLAEALGTIAATAPVAYCAGLAARAAGLDDAIAQMAHPNIHTVPPLGYADFISLQLGAGALVTDAATVQDEAAGLGVPCYSLGALSERPITLTHGTNVLLGDDDAAIAEVRPTSNERLTCAIPLWDGHAADRIADTLLANYAVQASWASLSAP
ncbi:MAG: UDP-N-acetylglucosamine 2-epimerase [Baekduia sp.]